MRGSTRGQLGEGAWLDITLLRQRHCALDVRVTCVPLTARAAISLGGPHCAARPSTPSGGLYWGRCLFRNEEPGYGSMPRPQDHKARCPPK